MVALLRLAGLSECLLGRRLAKSQSLRCSNWEARPLCTEQQQYAALDAVASLRLYEVSLPPDNCGCYLLIGQFAQM